MYTVSAATVAWFALAWFVVGVVAGHGLRVVAPKQAKTSRRRGGSDKKRKKRPEKSPKKPTRESGDSADGVEIYVGNLPYGVSKRDVRGAFSEFGDVVDVRIIRSKNSGKSRGYGFVVMRDSSGADKAIKAMSGKNFKGRELVVNEAKSRAR